MLACFLNLRMFDAGYMSTVNALCYNMNKFPVDAEHVMSIWTFPYVSVYSCPAHFISQHVMP